MQNNLAADLKKYGVTHKRYDYDVPANKRFAKQLGVRSLPADFLVEVLPDGKLKVVKKWSNYGRTMNLKELRLFINPNKTGPEPPNSNRLPFSLQRR